MNVYVSLNNSYSSLAEEIKKKNKENKRIAKMNEKNPICPFLKSGERIYTIVCNS